MASLSVVSPTEACHFYRRPLYLNCTFRLNVGVGSTTELTQEGVQFLTMLFDCYTVLKPDLGSITLKK